MANVKQGKYWLLITFVLLSAIIIGVFVLWQRYEPQQPVEISLPVTPNRSGTIYLSGAVMNPGLYPFSAYDTIDSLLQAAGGTSGNANISGMELIVTSVGNTGPQRVDINRAETWLLEALPGIGETLAQRIVDYRQQNGLFHSTADLLKVTGMGTKTFQQIESLVTVGD